MDPLSPQPWDGASQSPERFVRSLFDRVSYLLVPPQVKVVPYEDAEGVKAKPLRYPLPAGLATPVPMAGLREMAVMRQDVLHAIGWRQTEETDDMLPDFLRLANGTLREMADFASRWGPLCVRIAQFLRVRWKPDLRHMGSREFVIYCWYLRPQEAHHAGQANCLLEGLYRPAVEIAPLSDQLGMSTTGPVTDLLHSVSRAVRSDLTYFIARLSSRRKDTMIDRAYTRPIDRSLEAYKAWIENMVIRLGGSGGDMTEEQWIETHREFWSDADEPEASEGNAEE